VHDLLEKELRQTLEAVGTALDEDDEDKGGSGTA